MATEVSQNPQTIGDLNKVPEIKLKQRKLKNSQRQRQDAKTKAQIAKNVQHRKQPKPSNFKRLEYFVERANRREWERIRVIKEARKAEHMQESNISNLAKAETDCPVVVVIRICRQHKLTKAGKKLMKDFRLSNIFNASLFRMDQEMLLKLTILRVEFWGHFCKILGSKSRNFVNFPEICPKFDFFFFLEDNIVWGYASEQTVKELILKRGRTGTLKNPEPLNNNLKIEQALGHKNVICLEDLIFELTKAKSTKDENDDAKFTLCRNYLLPFQLSMPEGGKRAVSNFENSDLKPGFRKEKDLKELLNKMV